MAHDQLDLDAAERVTYLLEQSFRYDYADRCERLRHRLVVLPPPRHGEQYRRAYRSTWPGGTRAAWMRRDVHGNTVVRLRAERVERGMSFRIEALVERVHAEGPSCGSGRGARRSEDVAGDPADRTRRP